VTVSRPVDLILFDLDGTLVDHDGAAAAAVEQWLLEVGWAAAGDVAALVVDWDEIAERHFPAYRTRQTTFQGQRRARLREFLPRLGIDASTWSDERLDTVFDGYLAAYEAAWRPYPDAAPCLEGTAARRLGRRPVERRPGPARGEGVPYRSEPLPPMLC